MRYLIPIIAYVLVGCGQPELNQRTPPTGPYIADATIKSLVSEFLAQATEFGLTAGHYWEMTDIAFIDDMPQPKLGTCYWSDRSNWIELRTGLEGIRLRTALWHELGHCLYRMEHTDGPNQIMSASVHGFEYERALPEFWESVPPQFKTGE
jgi:hypothetical protein